MNKPWLKEYPEGVSAEIDLGAYHSVVDLFETSCQAYASRPAYLNMGVSMTYQALDQYSKHLLPIYKLNCNYLKVIAAS